MSSTNNQPIAFQGTRVAPQAHAAECLPSGGGRLCAVCLLNLLEQGLGCERMVGDD